MKAPARIALAMAVGVVLTPLLARAQLYDGDFLAASRQAQVMSSLAFHDLRRIIKEYARNIQYAFVGDTTQVPLKEFTKR